jgi:hypothetical protein
MSKQNPLGQITTLLDLTDRDAQEDDIFPLTTEVTWFTRDKSRRTIIFSPQIQLIPFRGPAEFGQRFTFDIGSLNVGDLLFGAAVQINLGHWLDTATQNRIQAGIYTYSDVQTAWEYANSLGTSIIQSAELEIDGKTIETIDGDFINIFSLLYSDYNTQYGVSYDHLGRLPTRLLKQIGQPGSQLPNPRIFPTESGTIHCPLPFFFGRIQRMEAFPLTSIKEGSSRIHITLRPFSECVRQIRGFRDSCVDVPTSKQISFYDASSTQSLTIHTLNSVPLLKSVGLLTHGALVDGEFRQTLLHKPFEMIHRELQTFSFNEPMRYVISKSTGDSIHIQLPLEANHPLEEIIWFVRRKDVLNNNEWTNYSDTAEVNMSADPAFSTAPILVSASLQVNGISLIEADEQYFRQHIARKHKGGYSSYSNYIYGFSFAERPGDHQPTGSINASRANSIRLNLEVLAPKRVEWEVKVYCLAINWMRFENGLANAIFED